MFLIACNKEQNKDYSGNYNCVKHYESNTSFGIIDTIHPLEIYIANHDGDQVVFAGGTMPRISDTQFGYSNADGSSGQNASISFVDDSVYYHFGQWDQLEPGWINIDIVGVK